MVVLLAVSIVAVVLQQALRHIDYNFAIFRLSYHHLAAGQDLYAAYPAQQADLFKYSPTFAVLFAPFALIPPLPALVLWDATNVFLLWFAIRRLLPSPQANLALGLMYLEVLHTTQRAQSNALVTALMVLAWVWMEERRQMAAALAVVLGAAIKLFPALAIIPAVFHPRRLRMTVLTVFGGVVALLLPLLVTSGSLLATQYASWRALEVRESGAGAEGGAAGLYGGVMHWVHQVFHTGWPNWTIQLGGLVLLAAPLARVERWAEAGFRLRVLCSILLFSTIFNHQVEGPTFVIAMTGVAIWFVISRRTAVDVVLLSAVLLVVSLGSNDLMPHAFRDYVAQHKLKTLPCLAVWIVLQAELLGLRRCDG